MLCSKWMNEIQDKVMMIILSIYSKCSCREQTR